MLSIMTDYDHISSEYISSHKLSREIKHPSFRGTTHELTAIHIISFRHLSCKFDFVLKKNDILCFQNYFGDKVFKEINIKIILRKNIKTIEKKKNITDKILILVTKLFILLQLI
jgi:hypothetical protein